MHSVPHLPLAQNWPLPQLTPASTALHVVVVVPGWHVAHGSFGSAAPGFQ
jgi:hypothetical protein